LKLLLERQDLERAILKSADLLEKGEFVLVERAYQRRSSNSVCKKTTVLDHADPEPGLLALKSNNGQVSTGWPSMDKKLYGGFNRGELQIFAGGSGSGKACSCKI